MTKRYEVRLIGPTTDDRWAVVATRQTMALAVYQYDGWHSTHSIDHGIVLWDREAPKGQQCVRSDMNGCTIHW